MQELASRQQEVLDFVCRFRDEHGCPPSLREISEQIGTKGTAPGNDAELHLGFGEGCLNRFQGSLQAFNTGNQDILYPAINVGAYSNKATSRPSSSTTAPMVLPHSLTSATVLIVHHPTSIRQ